MMNSGFQLGDFEGCIVFFGMKYGPQLCGDSQKPLFVRIPELTNQDSMESHKFFFEAAQLFLARETEKPPNWDVHGT